jgi:hypothetical protein
MDCLGGWRGFLNRSAHSCDSNTSCNVRVVAVVIIINAPYLCLSLKNRAIESKLQPSTTMIVVVCKRPYKAELHKKVR